ncbi:GD15664 [Drosophila simulans]|uniref:GD15664 n=1 Tax=Drosophila simulans TaxID=7240 RepID=B4R6P1_DROSI|nr:GD15664 [Drosophila simulans]
MKELVSFHECETCAMLASVGRGFFGGCSPDTEVITQRTGPAGPGFEPLEPGTRSDFTASETTEDSAELRLRCGIPFQIAFSGDVVSPGIFHASLADVLHGKLTTRFGEGVREVGRWQSADKDMTNFTRLARKGQQRAH